MKKDSLFQKITSRIKEMFCKYKADYQKEPSPNLIQEKEPWENPYISYSRQVIEQILSEKQLDYRRFRPVLIDTDTPNQHFGEEDDVDQLLAQLEHGLNFLEIFTDRQEHFLNWTTYMEEEYGLIVRLLPKSEEDFSFGNVVLDLERNGSMRTGDFSRGMVYIPFQKKRWYEVEDGEEISSQEEGEILNENGGKAEQNKEKTEEDYLDINVPIGYNMMIVKVKKNV